MGMSKDQNRIAEPLEEAAKQQSLTEPAKVAGSDAMSSRSQKDGTKVETDTSGKQLSHGKPKSTALLHPTLLFPAVARFLLFRFITRTCLFKW